MRASRVGTFEERFKSRYLANTETGCWDWLGPKNAKGYGRIAGVVIDGVRYTPKEHPMLAHRASWLLHVGPINHNGTAHGTVVMHRCDNPACVNPDHLMLGTQADNVKDMVRKGRKVAGEWQLATGPQHFRAVFKDPAVVEAIRKDTRSGSVLAREYGVNKSTINRLRGGKTYPP